MNKTGFIKSLEKRLGYEENKCIIINSIIEDTSLFGKKSKDKMINNFMKKLDVSLDEATNIYETSMDIIVSNIKDKIKHPFRKENL